MLGVLVGAVVVLLFGGGVGVVGDAVVGVEPLFYVVVGENGGSYTFTLLGWGGAGYVFSSYSVIPYGSGEARGPDLVFPRGLDTGAPLVLDVNSELSIERVLGSIGGDAWVAAAWAGYSRGNLEVFERDKNPYRVAAGEAFPTVAAVTREPGVYSIARGVLVYLDRGDAWTALKTLFEAEAAFLAAHYPLSAENVSDPRGPAKQLADYIAGYLAENMDYSRGCVWTRDGCDVHAAALAAYALGVYGEATGNESLVDLAHRVLVAVAAHGVRGDGAPLYVYHNETGAWGTEFYDNSRVNLTWTAAAGPLWLALDYCNTSLGDPACAAALERMAEWAAETVLPGGCWAQAYLWNRTPVEWEESRWKPLNPDNIEPIYCSTAGSPPLHTLLLETRGPGASPPAPEHLLHPLPVAWTYSTGWDLQGLPPLIAAYVAAYEETGNESYLAWAQTWWLRTLALTELREIPLSDGNHSSLGLLASHNACYGCWAIGGGLPQLLASTPPGVPAWAREMTANMFAAALNRYGVMLPEIQCSEFNADRNEGVWFKNLPWVLLALVKLTNPGGGG